MRVVWWTGVKADGGCWFTRPNAQGWGEPATNSSKTKHRSSQPTGSTWGRGTSPVRVPCCATGCTTVLGVQLFSLVVWNSVLKTTTHDSAWILPDTNTIPILTKCYELLPLDKTHVSVLVNSINPSLNRLLNPRMDGGFLTQLCRLIYGTWASVDSAGVLEPTIPPHPPPHTEELLYMLSSFILLGGHTGTAFKLREKFHS